MIVKHHLELEDHLAWYDFYNEFCSPRGTLFLSLIDYFTKGRRRIRYQKNLLAPNNQKAFGDREVEITSSAVREYNETFNYSHRWEEFAIVGISKHHVFFAHASMNAIIVPVRLLTPVEREELFRLMQDNPKAKLLLRDPCDLTTKKTVFSQQPEQ